MQATWKQETGTQEGKSVCMTRPQNFVFGGNGRTELFTVGFVAHHQTGVSPFFLSTPSLCLHTVVAEDIVTYATAIRRISPASS